MDQAVTRAIRDSVAEGFDAQLRFTEDLVRIPSLRFAEAPAQDLMADALRARGWTVDDWALDLADLEPLPGFGPIEGDFSRARSVVGVRRAAQTRGRSLILQGHVDVVPPGPTEMWATPPFEPVIRDGWMRGRGAGDMKSGLAAALFALDALGRAGFEPAARVCLQSVIEEESTGLGALSTLQRGYRADLALIPEPTAGTVWSAQVGVLWFKLRVRGRPAHVAYAGDGANAIFATHALIAALQRLEADWNARAADHPAYAAVEHPLNFNVGKIHGGDWASSVPAWCDADCRMGLLPGQDLAAARAEIAACVAEAARADPFLAENPPEIVWNGFRAEGYVVGDDAAPGLATLEAALADVRGAPAPIPRTAATALTDARFYGLYYAIPAFCYGPRAEAIHGFDEGVELASLREVTETLALFIARWCGLNRLPGRG